MKMSKYQKFSNASVLGLAGFTLYVLIRLHNLESKEKTFKEIPAVHTIDSAYSARKDSLDKALSLEVGSATYRHDSLVYALRETHRSQIDSLKEMYHVNLELFGGR